MFSTFYKQILTQSDQDFNSLNEVCLSLKVESLGTNFYVRQSVCEMKWFCTVLVVTNVSGIG